MGFRYWVQIQLQEGGGKAAWTNSEDIPKRGEGYSNARRILAIAEMGTVRKGRMGRHCCNGHAAQVTQVSDRENHLHTISTDSTDWGWAPWCRTTFSAPRYLKAPRCGPYTECTGSGAGHPHCNARPCRRSPELARYDATGVLSWSRSTFWIS